MSGKWRECDAGHVYNVATDGPAHAAQHGGAEFGQHEVDEPSDRPDLVNVRTMPRPVESDDWIIVGLARPRAIVVIGSPEGVGKSFMRKEIEHRLGSGIGPVFGHFAVPGPVRIATFEEENGEEEEWRRDELTLTALGATRESIADNVFRASYTGVDLTKPADQEYIRAQIATCGARAVWFDTGGAMMGDEWGEPMKVAYRFLRSLELTVFLNVHLVKPSRSGGTGPAHGQSLSDVMGQWTRSADVVCIVSDLGEGRVRMLVRKRVPRQDLILAQAAGLWNVVAEGAAATTSATSELVILRAIKGGVGDTGTLADVLNRTLRTVQRAVKNLRQDSLIEKRNPLRITDAGLEHLAENDTGETTRETTRDTLSDTGNDTKRHENDRAA